MGGFFMSVNELRTLLDSDAMPTVIDVRKPAAFEGDTTILPNARWRDPAEVDRWRSELDPAAPVFVYCVHGHEVSQGVAKVLRRYGHDVHVLEGGIEAWREAGAPLAPRPEPGRAE